MAYARIYKYRIDPAKRDKCRALLREAQKIYERAGIKPIYIYENFFVPGEMADIGMAQSREDYERRVASVDKDPRIAELFASFQQMMLPGSDIVTEHAESN
jgi:hypothetical protein